mmetsp:Transcript_22642/g.49453  ORF Transcript_22642/g.49453 Transcript_22642/m.49453 type:complete len:208 (-) Transcript_22642:141-764(-)
MRSSRACASGAGLIRKRRGGRRPISGATRPTPPFSGRGTRIPSSASSEDWRANGARARLLATKALAPKWGRAPALFATLSCSQRGQIAFQRARARPTSTATGAAICLQTGVCHAQQNLHSHAQGAFAIVEYHKTHVHARAHTSTYARPHTHTRHAHTHARTPFAHARHAITGDGQSSWEAGSKERGVTCPPCLCMHVSWHLQLLTPF